MSHHGNDHERETQMSDMMKKLFGEYPDGKLNNNDEGAIAMAVSTENGRVRLEFPKPVKWIALTGDEAAGLAQTLLDHARQAGMKEPFVLKL